MQHGSRLGWFINPDDIGILVFHPGQQPVLYQGNNRLPTLAGIDLELTVDQVFGWLKMETT